MPEIRTFKSSEESLSQERLVSLDIFRGLVLFLLLLEAANWGWQHHLAKGFPDSWFVKFIELQASHMPWSGCSFWDLIQPAFMFMVGVSMAFSYAKRAEMGDRYGDMLTHALIRSVILVVLGIFLRSTFAESTNWTFEDVLTQIGLGYFWLFLMWRKWWRIQAVTAVSVLLLYWLFFVIWPFPGPDFDWSIASGDGWSRPLQGFAAHWNKNANPAHGFDLWLLNGFPRPEAFVANSGGYQTLSFFPAFATMMFGLMAGEYLNEEEKGWSVVKVLGSVGVVLVVIGLVLDMTGVCPIVKRIWTPSFAFYSGGWCLIILALLYATMDLLDWDRFMKPFTILGLNSIAVYVMCWVLAPWLNRMLKVHLGKDYGVAIFGEPFRLLIENIVVMTIVWLIAWWMYRRRLFLKI